MLCSGREERVLLRLPVPIRKFALRGTTASRQSESHCIYYIVSSEYPQSRTAQCAPGPPSRRDAPSALRTAPLRFLAVPIRRVASRRVPPLRANESNESQSATRAIASHRIASARCAVCVSPAIRSVLFTRGGRQVILINTSVTARATRRRLTSATRRSPLMASSRRHETSRVASVSFSWSPFAHLRLANEQASVQRNATQSARHGTHAADESTHHVAAAAHWRTWRSARALFARPEVRGTGSAQMASAQPPRF